MKKIKLSVISILFSLVSQQAFAFDESTVDESKNWFCYAQGSQSSGSPYVSDIWLHVYGEGNTQQTAMRNTLDNCYHRALRNCMILNCGPKR